MVDFTMNRLLLSILVASAVPSGISSDADEWTRLEDMEDLLLKDDSIKVYSESKGHNRADTLLLQFNSARRSPSARNQLMTFKDELQGGHMFSNILSEEEIQTHIASIDQVIGTCPADSAGPENRRIDGACNNLARPAQGAAESPVIRLLPNAYDDGLSKPRTTSVTGGKLPSARDVSREVFNTNSNRKEKTTDVYTSLRMHVGQLIDHDITAVHSQDVECSGCSVEGECYPIPIDESDPEFGGIKPCFTFRRSTYVNDAFGIRQHVNSITSYLDGSFVYGSDDATAAELADDNGLMIHLIDKVTHRDLLPPDKYVEDCDGVDEAANIYCCKAGDSRAAEQPGLTSMHTLFMREHNRIAEEIRVISPSLSASEIYQKARKIVIAEWQHIVYNEFLPPIVGDELYHSKKLIPTAPFAYDPNVDASIANVFATAAYRFGHTMIPDTILRATKNFKLNLPVIKLREGFFNATYMFDETICDGAVDSILRGMAVQYLPLIDGHLAYAITTNLFGDPDKKGDGFDLAALNIQRGREHGLPSYTVIRKELCGFDDINSLDDLRGIMSEDNIRNLRKVYGIDGVRDIDPFVGFLLEEPLPNALVGPTLACIFGDQFYRLKFGDRFFYQNPDQFTQAQMDEIAKASMARLMCDNVEAVTNIQPYMFVVDKDFRNPDDSESAGRKKRSSDSFYEHSRSGAWPQLDGLDNSRTNCTLTDQIPIVDIMPFI